MHLITLKRARGMVFGCQKERKEGREENEKGKKGERQIGRKEGSFKVIHTQVTSVKGLMRLPRETFQKELLAYVLSGDELGK